ncbi:MAG: hypothetical protein E7015_01625 [Alphaproteobacteria bacterium]|nr:hypothetical protein [Alphaproteobacteria bacterium]
MRSLYILLSSKLSLIPKDLIPTVAIVFIAIAVVLIIISFVACVAYINSQPKKKPKLDNILTRDTLLKKNDDTNLKIENDKIIAEKLPIISGRFGEMLTLWGILKSGPITKAFFKTLDIIKSSTYDIRWRYKLPCFAVIGDQRSGKTTLLNSLRTENFASEDSDVDKYWKIFKKGAFFEFPNVEQSDKATFWSFIGDLFTFIRPRRPLDGVIVTVSVEKLMTNGTNVTQQSHEMFERLFQLQKEINFRLPIYIIITKTDLIPGFQEMALSLGNNSQQIFGWSSPYSLDAAFSSEWIRDFFLTVNAGIRKSLFFFSKRNPINKNLEKAVLFGTHLQKLKPALFNYLQTMFRTHNPQDGLMLRGVYFIGKQQLIESDTSGCVEISALTPGINVDASQNRLNDAELYFVQDLFNDKIFKEANLAHPIRSNTISMSKNEYRNKAIFAGSTVVLSIGWFIGNSCIKSHLNDYYHTMVTIKYSLEKINKLEGELQTSDDQIMINNKAATLLQNMPTVKVSDFVSIFVPQSWFSNIGYNIKSTLELVFDSIVVKAMYIDLNFNAKNILISSSDVRKAKNSKHDLFDISTFDSFQKLKEFVKNVDNVKKISSQYNSLRHSASGDHVVDITESLFKDKFEITDEMRQHVPNKKILPPQFHLSDFQSNIENTLNKNFILFLKDVLDPLVAKVLENVSSDIDRLNNAGKNVQIPYSVQDLAKLYNKVELVEEIFNNKNFSWIRGSRFIPCEDYEILLTEIKKLNVIRDSFLQTLISSADAEFFKYRDELRQYSSSMTGTLLTNLSPSEEFLQLKQEIKILLDMPFVCIIPAGHYISEIPTDKFLMWDIKRLKDLTNLIDKYNDFAENMPDGMRSKYFDQFKSIAKKCFYPTIKEMVGNAEILDDLPITNSRTLLESCYQRQARNIRNVSIIIPKIMKILDEITDEDSQKDFGLSYLIISQYTLLLEKIDALFNLEKPYSTNSALFDDWDGKGNPKFMSLNNKENVQQYLNAQFDRIRFMAKDLASPIVDLLSTPVIFDKVRDRRLINKWKEIINNVEDYENKKPGNSIAALETFITDNLSKVSIDSFDEKGEISDISQNEGDYFLSKRSTVAKSLMSRAEIVQYDKAVEMYKNLSLFFNQNLANKFPFGQSNEEASLQNIKSFIDLYDTIDTSMYKILEKHQKQKGINNDVLIFLKSLQSVVPFFKLWLQHSQTSDPNTCPVCFNILLRPFANMEAMTSSVIDRIVNVNNVIVSDNDNVAFFNGNKIDITFGWVASSDEQPNEKLSSGMVSIRGNKATFSYVGKWAMFKLIEQQKTGKGIEYPNGVTLQFDVPIVDASQGNASFTSKMVFKVTPLHRNGDKLEPLSWPNFPTEAPDLYHSSLNSVQNVSNNEMNFMEKNISSTPQEIFDLQGM